MPWEVVPYDPASWERFPVAGSLEVNGPSLDLNFLGGTLDSRITFARASTATSGLYTDAAGSSYTSYATGVARISTTNGLLMEEQRTNSLLNSDTPATQTTASLAAGTYTLWVIGTGSATSSAGTATGSGFGAASAGTPNTFTLTGAGTVTITKSGTLTRFQLEKGAFPTSYIPTTNSTATRAKDTASMPVGSWFNGVAGTLVVAGLFVTTNSGVASCAAMNDGTSANRAQIQRPTSTHNIAILDVLAGVTVASNLQVGIETDGAPFQGGTTYSAAGVTTALGGTAGSSTSAAMSGASFTTLYIGSSAGDVSQADGFIRRVRYWPRMLNQNDLNGVTT